MVYHVIKTTNMPSNGHRKQPVRSTSLSSNGISYFGTVGVLAVAVVTLVLIDTTTPIEAFLLLSPSAASATSTLSGKTRASWLVSSLNDAMVMDDDSSSAPTNSRRSFFASAFSATTTATATAATILLGVGSTLEPVHAYTSYAQYEESKKKKKKSGKVAFTLEQAAQMDAEATTPRRVFSEVTEANRRARISFGSTGKLLFEVPYELDGTVEFMWVKDSKGTVVAAKKIRNGESFPATLTASVPAGMITVVAKCTDTLWEGSVKH